MTDGTKKTTILAIGLVVATIVVGCALTVIKIVPAIVNSKSHIGDVC